MIRNKAIETMLLSAGTVFLITSCQSSPVETGISQNIQDEIPEWLWDSRPRNGSLIFIASGNRRANREEEIISARKDAALQAGVYAAFWGASQGVVLSDTRGTGRIGRVRVRYSGSAEDKAASSLKEEQRWRSRRATYVRFSLEDETAQGINWNPEFVNGEPTWMMIPPRIEGYYVAVGSASHRSTLAKTLRAADASAADAMITLLQGSTKVVTASREQSSETVSSSSGSSVSYDRGFGEIKGFLIIQRWIDSAGSGWALSVCSREKN